jgi:hypothetical protein
MRLVRLYFYRRKVVIYHATWEDIRNRLLCLVGVHEYLTVMEYPSVGAKECRCLHCLKARYTLEHQLTSLSKVSH